MWLKLDCLFKKFRGAVNAITPTEGATERTRSILGVKDNFGAGEETGNGEVNKVEKVDADEERGKGEVNKLEGWTKTEGVGVTEESVSLASISSARIWSSSIVERILSERIPRLKLRSTIGFGGGVINAGAGGGLINTAELEAEVLSDWGRRRENSRDKDDTVARI